MLRIGIALLAAVLLTAQAPLPKARPSQETIETPQVRAQQKAKDTVGGNKAASNDAPPQYDKISQHEDAHGGQHAAEVTFLGVKPGEWLLSAITFMLWWSTRRLVLEAKGSSERQLRAYVSAIPLKISILEDNETVIFHVILKNWGQTPAYEINALGGAAVGPHPQVEQVPMQVEVSEDNLPAKFILQPGADHKIVVKWPMNPALENDVSGNPHAAVYVFGKVSYLDAFGNDQTQEFCAALAGNQLSEDLVRARNSHDRTPIPAGLKFTPYNNGASHMPKRRRRWFWRK